MLVVADTTPINYLVLIGQVPILASLYTYCISDVIYSLVLDDQVFCS
jgi:hypothetical protein